MNQLLQAPLPSGISERLACHVLDIGRNTFRAIRARYHFCGPVSPHRRKRKDTQQPRALSVEERTQAKAVLSSTEYQDQPPAQVYYSLLQQGTYLCSIGTMHRLLPCMSTCQVYCPMRLGICIWRWNYNIDNDCQIMSS